MPTRGLKFLIALAIPVGFAACAGSGDSVDASPTSSPAQSASSTADPSDSDESDASGSPSGSESPSTTTASSSPSDPPSPCAAADLLSERGEYERAIDEYLKVLDRSPVEPCVAAGMEKTYAAADSVVTDGPDPRCFAARTYLDAEANSEARRVLTLVLDEGRECAGITYKDTETPEKPKTWLERIKDALPAVGAVVLAVALVLSLLRRFKFFRRLRRKVAKPQVVVKEFTSTGDAPKLSLHELVNAISRRASEDGPNDTFHIVDAHQDLVTAAGAIEKIHASLSAVGIVARVVGWGFGRDKWELSGELRLENGPDETWRLYCNSTFKANDGQSPTPSEFSVLVKPVTRDGKEVIDPTEQHKDILMACVAGWVKRVGSRLSEAELPKSPSDGAYGWLRGGIKAQELVDLEAALDCYEKANSQNQEDIGREYIRAHIARALVHAEAATTPEQTESVISKLVAAVGVASGATTKARADEADTKADALRLDYALASARVHRALQVDPTGAPNATARELLEAASSGASKASAEGADWLKNPPDGRPPAASAKAFVNDTLIPGCNILEWGAQLQLLTPVTGETRADVLALSQKVGALSATGKVSFRVRYNVACFWSTWSARCPRLEPAGGGDPIQRSFEQLQLALRDPGASDGVKRGMATWAGTDPSLAKLRKSKAADVAELLSAWSANS